MKVKINKNAVGSRIKQIRLDRGYTLEAFGKLFNTSKSNVLRWEQGISLPNKERIKNISKIADLTVNELLYGSIDEYLENNIDTLLKNNSILKEDMREVFINTYKVIDKTKEIARNKNIDLNDIESLNRMCNRVILEIKDDIRKNSKPIPLWLNHEAPITSDVLSLILLEWLYKHIEETNVTKEQAKKDITVKISELINKL
jgi:DNA-binding helix-turn-helix protein